MTAIVQGAGCLLERTDAARQLLNKRLTKKEKFGQYFTNPHVADLMASMMAYPQKRIRILDPGAGAGSLFTACVQRICTGGCRPESIEVVAYEIDGLLSGSINSSMARIRRVCQDMGVEFSGTLVQRDFLGDYVSSSDMLSDGFTHVIMNPPYGKISASSETYDMLRGAGLHSTNTYSAFIAISHNLVDAGGQLTFISPRSFCNGTYFHRFRKNLMESMSLRSIHLFRSRTSPFSDDGVLQENIIVCAEKNTGGDIIVSSSAGPKDRVARRRVKKSDVVFDDDQRLFIHIVLDRAGARISKIMRSLPCTLEEVGVQVSTGRVVDFRVRDETRFEDEKGAVPLVRPFNIVDGEARFPVPHKKHPTFIMESGATRRLLVDNGNYVLVKRFTTIEQKKRVVAAVWDKGIHNSATVGFENRVNYFHRNGGPLWARIARGLWVFLNSGMVDVYFRQFNGSTQVNAGDLRYLRYPNRTQLEALGESATPGMGQDGVDALVADLLSGSGVAWR